MLHDPTPHRVSACPVHFIWDGQGRGRALVRLGFLGGITTGMVAAAGGLLHASWTQPATVTLGGVAAVVYLTGQVLSRLTRA